MAKGRKTEPWIEQLIKDEFSQLFRHGGQPTWTNVRDIVRLRLINNPETRNHVERYLPKERKIQQIIKALRPILEGQRDNPLPIDRNRWSIVSSVKHGISAESIPMLIEITRWCYRSNQGFSIREAIWADRLRLMFIEKNISAERMLYWAQRYATREITRTDDATLNSEDLDAQLADFSNAEFASLYLFENARDRGVIELTSFPINDEHSPE